MANLPFDLVPRAELEHEPRFASTLANGLDILRCFSAAQPTLGNKEIAEALGLSRPTVARLTFTLVTLGYLRRDDASKRYSLAPGVLSLIYPLLLQLTVRRVAEHDLAALSEKAGGPVSIGTRDRLQVVYVDTIHDRGNNGAKPDIGSSRPLLHTAMGRALLYTFDAAERELLLPLLLEQEPQQGDAARAALEEAFAQIARMGFCTSYGSWRPELAGLAAPLRYRAGNLPFAINLTLPIDAVKDGRAEQEFGPYLARLAQSIDRRLGVDV